jgi:hypothetical protein
LQIIFLNKFRYFTRKQYILDNKFLLFGSAQAYFRDQSKNRKENLKCKKQIKEI